MWMLDALANPIGFTSVAELSGSYSGTSAVFSTQGKISATVGCTNVCETRVSCRRRGGTVIVIIGYAFFYRVGLAPKCHPSRAIRNVICFGRVDPRPTRAKPDQTAADRGTEHRDTIRPAVPTDKYSSPDYFLTLFPIELDKPHRRIYLPACLPPIHFIDLSSSHFHSNNDLS